MTRRTWMQTAQSAMAAVALPAQFDPERAVFRRVNELRAARGLGPLEWSDELALCARQQSERKRDLRFPGHEDPQRGGVAQRLNTAAVRWAFCGENLFSMNGYEEIADYAIVFWWYSLGHQQNMLGENYTKTGVGIVRGANGIWFATQIFIS